MTPGFLTDDFLLESEQAKQLYFGYAERLPVVDYHCHLPPEDIASNRSFDNLTQIWLAGDHYKWRAMRTCGVDERFITGDASDREKFQKWAETVPKTLRNPLYHWTHLELRRPFGIADRVLDEASAQGIWDHCNEKLRSPAFTTQGLLRQMNVEVVCTTDDPVDNLSPHRTLARDGLTTRVFPAFRPDKAMDVANPNAFVAYAERLAAAANQEISTFDLFLAAIDRRHAYFHEHGCRLSDHGLETVYAEDYTNEEVESAYQQLRQGKPVSAEGALKFKSAVLREVAIMNHARGWVMQLHLGALRNNNSRMMRVLGPDTGFDSIGDFEIARPLARFLDRLDTDNRLAKTILYNLNPRDNELFATMLGNFQDGSVPGKIQYGSAWWFLDQRDGMTRQLEALSNMGILSQFIGMLTDSRSFLSYPRHEYFRRLLCNILGDEMRRGLIPNDIDLVGRMVSDICYYNVKRYLNLPESISPTER
jgi:glucuronate isomerase